MSLCTVLSTAADHRPNILVLMAEDLSPRIGAFGDPVAQTPNLDAFALEGVRFTHTFTTAGVCAPSRAAHILGMHQMSVGTQHMRSSSRPDGGYKSLPPAHVKAYPELLRAAGYYTFTDNKLDYQFSGALSGSGPFSIWSDEGNDAHWRNRPEGKPFFGLINFPVTHESGVFPPLGTWPHSLMHFATQLLRAYSAPDVGPTKKVATQNIPLPPYYPDTPTVRENVARHYNNISVMDAQVGQLLQQLDEDGLADNTIVIWTTDHGDGLPRAKRELYDSGIRVPMIVRWPGKYRPPDLRPGDTDDRLVSFVDFAPTLLNIAGVASPAYLHGRDFVNDPPRDYVYAARDRIDEVMDRQRAVRDTRFKYIRSWHPQQEGGHPLEFRDNMPMMREMRSMYLQGDLTPEQERWFEAPGEERLFDLAVDPHELDDVSSVPQYADTLRNLRAVLSSWQSQVTDLSDITEAELVAQIESAGEAGITAAPVVKFKDGMLHIHCDTAGASIGYRLNQDEWQLYTGPVKVPDGIKIAAKAVRYGWEESKETRIDAQ